MLRVTTGTLKGCAFAVPRHIRATEGKVRQALFNILGEQIAGAQVIDGFAGSGMLGLEALSRGARLVVFLEAHPVCLRTIRANLARLDPVVVDGRPSPTASGTPEAAAIGAAAEWPTARAFGISQPHRLWLLHRARGRPAFADPAWRRGARLGRPSPTASGTPEAAAIGAAAECRARGRPAFADHSFRCGARLGRPSPTASGTPVADHSFRCGARLGRWQLMSGDALHCLRQLAGCAQPFDVILLDPPYEGLWGKKSLKAVADCGILSPAGVLCVEHARRDELPPRVGPLAVAKQHRYGETVLSFYRIATNPSCA